MRTSLPDISIRQLEYLVAVADAPTWASAAASVGVSPSALSQGLAELERRVGVDLFEAQGRRRVLRSSARPVLDHARQVVALTGDLVSWSGRRRHGATGRVRLGMIDVAAVTHYPDQLRAFRVDAPDVELTLAVAPSQDLLEQLSAGDLDLVVCVEPPETVPGITTERLVSESLFVYAPPEVVIAAPASWGPWVLFPTGSHTRGQIQRALVERGSPVDIAAESHQPDVLREMVLLGLGWTVLPASQSGIDDLVTGDRLLDRTLVLARRSGTIVDPAADELARRLTGRPGADPDPGRDGGETRV